MAELSLPIFLLNDSTATPTQEEKEWRDDEDLPAHVVFDISLTLFFILIGVPGNALVIFTVGYQLKKTDFMIYILNVAMADLVFLILQLLSIPTSLVDHWPYSQAFCQTNNFIRHLFYNASMLLVTAISAERCLTVYFPLWHHRRCSNRFSITVCAAVWAACAAISIPHFLQSKVMLREDNATTYCDGRMSLAGLVVTDGVLPLLAFLGVATFCNLAIVAKLQREPSLRAIRLYRVTVTMVTTFLLCWMPFQALHFAHAVMQSWLEPKKLVALSHVATYMAKLMFISSCVKPIIYFVGGSNPGQLCQQPLLIVMETAFSETSFLTAKDISLKDLDHSDS
uniref:G-protein coupled receptors family 1 profile domain-containing protein n=2 Tax=Latimeria chalumnae TaxID=7897 RepID=H3B5Y2_LATCH